MRVLVTGGTGVVGRSTVTALVQHGHVVTLLSRHASRDAAQWSNGVHPFDGDVADATSIVGAAEGCEAILHLAGIVEEIGTSTLERVNVEGTRNIVREAERAGARKFLYMSSLGADVGTSRYHRSKRKGEAITRLFSGAWTVIRPGNVYGPGDDQISLLLRLMRTLPALPVIGNGDQRFQPIWHADLAEALTRAIERDDLDGKELDVAGTELTSQRDLVERLARITGRDVPRIEVPDMLARLGVRLASAVGIGVAFNESQMAMLREGNWISNERENALVTVFDIAPTPLDEGLRQLAESQDEQLPDSGIGPLRRKRYWADIGGTAMTPESLMDHVRTNFAGLMASFIDARPEPGAGTAIQEDATLTLSLPLRGHVQVRVVENEARVLTLVSLAGHPIAGALRFLAEARGARLRFEIQVFDRAANIADLVMMRTLGERMQDAAWREMIERVVHDVGGTAPAGVKQDSESLDDQQADRIEDWLRDLVMERRREAAGI